METLPRARSLSGVCALALTAALASPKAEANGRFPAANYFLAGPGPEARLMVLRTTFGLVTSEDYGRTWYWTCEDGFGGMGMYDPALAIGSDGTIVAALTDGLSVSDRTHCAYARPATDPHVQIVDLAADATGRTVAAALGPFTSDNGLSISTDSGHTWRAGAHRPSFYVETVEVAPSDPMRIYLTGYLTGAVVLLLRSDDGGATMREMTRDVVGGNDAFIAGVDPTNPDVVYVRTSVELGTYLLRSDDGGAHLRRVGQTRARMLGFAISDDGQTVWIGSSNPTEGLQRSVRGGAFEHVGGPVSVSCLRYHAGVLFVCATEETDGYSLGYSTDNGDHILPAMSVRDVRAPSCPRGTSVGDLCPALWPAQDMTIRNLDASVVASRGIDAEVFVRPDVAVDAPADITSDLTASDAPDATVATDASAPIDADAAVEDVTDAPSPPIDAGRDANDASDASDASEDRPEGVDARADVASDVPADVPTVTTQPGDCDCEVGTTAPRGGHWGLLATLGLALRGRARRRASARRASEALWRS